MNVTTQAVYRFSLFLICGLLATTGCGGGDDEKKANVPKPRPAPAPIQVAKASQSPLAKRPTRPAVKNRGSAQNPIDPKADPADVFRMALVAPDGSAPYQRFRIVEKTPERIAAVNRYTVQAPDEKSHPDGFRIAKWGTVERPAHPPHSKLKVPSGFQVIQESGFSQEGLPRRVRSLKDGSIMALVPPGSGLLGSDAGDANAKPQLTTKLDPFYMDITEITVAQYRKFLEAIEKDRRYRVRVAKIDAKLAEDIPVTGIPWGDAVVYCRWAGKTLPSESQWEKAARGEAGFPHPWGYDDAIWFQKRTRTQISVVKLYDTDKSPFGIYDLAGNAREWCSDWYREDVFTTESKNSPLENWPGPKTAKPEFMRVVKGNGPDWNLWHRSGVNMREENPEIGFRGAFTVTGFVPDDPPKTAAGGKSLR